MRDREAGFTLLEMLVTIAVISILAAIALPSFMGESRKTRALAEIQPMFSDLRTRLEQYLQERGSYPPSASETALIPASAPGPKVALGPLPAQWTAIKLRLSGNDQVGCRYAWVTGLPADPIGAQATVFGFVQPVTDWYYLLAKCDMDRSGPVGGPGIIDGFSWYFASSVDPAIRRLNEGD